MIYVEIKIVYAVKIKKTNIRIFFRMPTTGRSGKPLRSLRSNSTLTKTMPRSTFNDDFNFFEDDTILKIVETRYDLHQCTMHCNGASNPCSQDAHEKFLKITRAYEVLKDEESRKK